MKKRDTCLLIFSLVALNINGQTLRRGLAADYMGPGAYSLDHVDVFSFSANQASLAQLKNPSVGIYSERRFLLSELNEYTLVAGLPTHSGNFGIRTVYNGFNDYNETQLGLAYAHKLGSKVDIGVQFNYHSIRITGYGNASAISFDAGTILHITDQLHAGIHVSNPVGGKFGKDQQEKLSSVYAFGLGYDASPKFFVSVEIEKEEDRPVNVNAGLQYKLIPQLLARTGISSATSSFWLGLGITLKSFRVDVTASYHPQLGITPGLLLLFNFKAKEK